MSSGSSPSDRRAAIACREHLISRRRALLTLSLALGLPVRASRAQPELPLRVGFISILPMTQLFIMEGEQWTRDVGLELILKRFSSGPPMVDALEAGDLDVAYIGIGPAMLARARGVDVKVVAANIIEQVALIGRGDLVAAFAATSSPGEAFRRFRESAGRPVKIATLPPGAVPDTILRYYLQEVVRVDPHAVDIVGVGEDEVEHLLLSGAVDAASIVEPILTIVLMRDRSTRIIARPGQMLAHHPGGVVLVAASVIAQNRGEVAKLVELHVRATEFVRNNPDRAAADVVEFLGRGLVDPAIIRKALTSETTRLIADPRAIVEATRQLQSYQERLGTQTAPIDVDALFDFSFYDAAVARR
ncbi:MAG TPA: ABC transporter substrate-binding protein [Candidatus Sulfotelmatobacter sp.]|nr:ABC transporter substrate-binding protein [Candidatus Sulfotelmatobacter sp.]